MNVGRNTLAMSRLRELFAELGYTDVKTYVQSGNAVFESNESSSRVADAIERKLADETRLPVSVIMRTSSELGRIVTGNPFLDDNGIDRTKLHVTFLSEAPKKPAVEALETVDSGDDRWKISGREVYLYCPSGYGRTRLSNTTLERLLSVRATTRNWNTIRTLYEMSIA